MIVWLASYPRSGNTLLRMMIKEAFGKFTYSEYNDRSDIGSDKTMARQVAHVSYPMTWDEFYRIARAKPKTYFVKTHHPPKDDAPAIYVLRDGKAATVSYYHYLNNYGKEATTLRDVIFGSVSFGSWSQHIESWSPRDRPNTLFLQYEEMCEDPNAAVEKIAAFLKLPIKGTYSTSFDDVHAKFPNFFRSGKRQVDDRQLAPTDRILFDLLHGPAMAQYGYRPGNGLDTQALRAALVEAGEDRTRLKALEIETNDLEQALKGKYKEVAGLTARTAYQKNKLQAYETRIHEDEARLCEYKALQTRKGGLKLAVLGRSRAIGNKRRHLREPDQPTQGVPLFESPSAAIAKLHGSPKDKGSIGIALFGFDRVELIENSLESLSRQGHLGHVHLWIDGDQGNPAKRERTEAVFDIGKKYQVKKIHRHRGNLGFRKMMLQAMTYMSLHYDKIIFLEDDCFPNRNCISTFSAELDEIRDRADVFSVYGHHFGLPNENEYFSRFQGWGWATTSDKLRPLLDDLVQCFFMTEEQFLAFAQEAMTPGILTLIDVTPGRQPSKTLKAFFAWDETLCLLAALRGLKHKKSCERVVFNCGAGERSTHFADVEWFRKPPFNMIAASEVWDHF